MRQAVVAVVLASGATLAACGDNGDSPAETKAEWQERHGAEVAGLSRDLDGSDAILSAGDRQAIQGACNLLEESASSARESVLPVPDATVDRALRDAIDAIDVAAQGCLEGVRSGAADDVEAAMDLMDQARIAFDAAEAAIANWSD